MNGSKVGVCIADANKTRHLESSRKLWKRGERGESFLPVYQVFPEDRRQHEIRNPAMGHEDDAVQPRQMRASIEIGQSSGLSLMLETLTMAS